jgi:hypothetical protein
LDYSTEFQKYDKMDYSTEFQKYDFSYYVLVGFLAGFYTLDRHVFERPFHGISLAKLAC